MTSTPARLSVLTGERFACVKISGRANFATSMDFKTLVEKLSDQGCSFFVLDLSDCTLMDSTFLGLLAGFGLKLTSGEPGRETSRLELYNPNPRITELLDNLGVLHLFRLAHAPLAVPENAQDCPLEPGIHAKEDVTRACLEAHRTLMSLSPENADRFKDVTQFLAEDLKRLQESARPAND